MKRKLTVQTVLFYVCYVAFLVVSGGVLQGSFSFGAFVGGLYSANALVTGLIYVVSMAIYGVSASLQAGVRCAVLLLFWLIHRFAKKKIGKAQLLLYTVIANVFFCAYQTDGYALLFEKLLCSTCGVAFGYVCLYAFRAVFVKGLAYRPQLDELVYISLFVVVASYCLSKLSVWNMQLVYFTLPFTILFCVVCFGDGVALVCSALVGVGNICATGSYDCCVFCVMCALVAVALCKLNRYVGALGVVFVDVVMSYFLQLHGSFSTVVFAPTVVSVLAFVVVPTSVYNKVADYVCGNAEKYLGKSVVRSLGENTSRRLYRLAEIFLSMKNAFFAMPSGTLSEADAQKAIVNSCSENVCRDCDNRNGCWRQNNNITEKSLLNLVSCALKRGKCTILDVPQTLSVKCDKVHGVLAEVNEQAQAYKEYLQRNEQMQSGKMLVAEQMGGVSRLLTHVAVDCKSQALFDKAKEKDVAERLVFHNVLCAGVTIAQQAEQIFVVATVSRHDLDVDVIRQVVGAVTKQNMTVQKVEQTESPSWVNVHLAVKPRYDIVFGVSSVAKNGATISGDTHSVLKTDNGKCIVALCDGMGSGNRAEQTSASAINLVENFYRAGFDNDVILSCVNKLFASSGNEVFCAVDVVVVDLCNGLADFIKLGASVGLVLHNQQVEVVTGSSLPLGVLEEMKPSVSKKALADGDVIVLVSDGVADCFANVNLLGKAFVDTMLNVPQSIAESMLSTALKQTKGVAQDDMTVVVAKLVSCT